MNNYMKNAVIFFLGIAGAVLLASTAAAVTISLDGSVVSGSNSNTVITGLGGIGFVDIEKVFNEHPLCKRSHEAFDAETAKRKTELKLLEVEISNLERIIVSSSTQLDTLKANLALLNKGIMPSATQAQISTSTNANAQAVAISTTQASTAAPVISTPVHLLPGMTLSSGTTQAMLQSSSSAAVTSANNTQVVPSSSSATSAISEAPKNYALTTDTAAASSDFRTLITSTLDDIKRYETDIDAMKTDIAKKKTNITGKLKQNKQELCDLEGRQTDEVLQDIYHIVENMAKELNLNIILDRKDVLYGQPYQDLTDKVIDRLQGR